MDDEEGESLFGDGPGIIVKEARDLLEMREKIGELVRGKVGAEEAANRVADVGRVGDCRVSQLGCRERPKVTATLTEKVDKFLDQSLDLPRTVGSSQKPRWIASCRKDRLERGDPCRIDAEARGGEEEAREVDPLFELRFGRSCGCLARVPPMTHAASFKVVITVADSAEDEAGGLLPPSHRFIPCCNESRRRG